MDALPFPTTDASKWAAEFVRLHGGDEGLMLSWFANAIEHGRGPDLAQRLDEAHAFGYREGHRRASDVEPSPDLDTQRVVDAARRWLAVDDERAAQWQAAGACGHADPNCPEMEVIRATGDDTFARQTAILAELRAALHTETSVPREGEAPE